MPRARRLLSPQSKPRRLSLAELDDAISRFIVDDYQVRAHSETHQAQRER